VRHFDATFEVEGLVLPPKSMYRSIGERAYYNFAAGSFFLSQKLCSRLHSTEVAFYSKKESLLFEPPFGRLRGNVRTSAIARWKARVHLPIRHNYRQHCAQRNAPAFKLLKEADFEVFRPAVATRCTDGGEIWHGGGDRSSCQVSPPLVQQ